MKHFLIISATSLFIVFLGLIGVVWVSSSLWFMWELLPADQEASIAYRHNTVLDYFIDEYEVSGLDLSVSPFVSRLAYSQGSNGDVMVVLPKLRNQFSLKESLEDSGWIVERRGLLLRAYRGSETKVVSNVTDISKRFLSKIFKGDYPISPLFIVDLKKDSLEYIDRDVWGIGSVRAGIISTRFAFNGYSFTNIPYSNSNSEVETRNDSLLLYVPINSLSMLPEDNLIKWNELFKDKLGINHTKPQIVNSIMNQEQLLLSLQNDHIAFGIVGNPEQFIEYMVDIVTIEESYTRPTTKAFRLPDGSLGYERVPGERMDVFEEDNSCLKTTGLDLKLWLCLKDNRTLISTNKGHINNVLNKEFLTDWEVDMGYKFLEMLQVKNINHLQAKGNSDYATVRLIMD